MPFDANALLNNPLFQMGASVIGNTGLPGALGTAFQNMSKINQMKQEAEAQRRNTDIAETNSKNTAAYQQGELADRAAQRDIQGKQYERQNALTQQQIAMEQRKQAMQDAFMQQFAARRGMQLPGMGGQPQQQPGVGAPQGMMQPQSLQGGGGMADMVKPAIFGQESGNRDNIGRSIDGAIGPGQVIPATFQRFAKPGEQITNPQDNRAVASRYMDYLASKAGGDPAKIAAGYFSGEGNMGTGDQPFKRDVKDGNGKSVSSYVRDVLARMGPNAPTGYTARVMAGLDQPPAKQTGVQGAPAGNSYMQDGEDAMMMGMMGVPGAAQAMEYAKMQQPQNIPAGGYTLNPATGEKVFNGDPYREHTLANEDARVGIDQKRFGLDEQKAQTEQQKMQLEAAKAAQQFQEQGRKMTKEQANDTMSYQNITSKFGAVADLADKLQKDPGLKYNSGYMGAVGMGSVPGLGRDTKVNLEQMKSKLKVDMLTELKAASANGSSGFGQLSEKEGQTLESYWANLDKAQSEDQLKGAIGDIKKWAQQAQGRYAQHYKSIYGKLPDMPDPADSGAAAPAAAPAAAAPSGIPKGWTYKGAK